MPKTINRRREIIMIDIRLEKDFSIVFIANCRPFAVVRSLRGRIILITLRILKLSIVPLQAGFI